MRNRFSIFIIVLTICVALTACDSGGDNQCTEITTVNNFMLIYQGCPNNGIKEVCNSFVCEFTQQLGGPLPPVDTAIINGEDCSRFDRCENLDCDLFSDIGEIEGDAILSTLEILEGNSFTGIANVNGVAPLDFTCDIILP
jgi:hypothetical protein